MPAAAAADQAGDRPLLVTVDDETPLLSASDLEFPFSEGVRSFYGQRNPAAGGWEIGCFSLYGQSASRTVVSPAGFRYVGVEEQSSIAIDACAGDPDCVDCVSYRVQSRNKMFGGQLGTRGRMTWRNWAVEG